MTKDSFARELSAGGKKATWLVSVAKEFFDGNVRHAAEFIEAGIGEAQERILDSLREDKY